MSASQVAIINLSLTMLGEQRITSIADNSKPAREADAIFDILRDKEMRARVWSFTKTRTQLAANTTTPPFGYAYAYDLPTDCLRLLSINNCNLGPNLADYRGGMDSQQYVIEGRQILITNRLDTTTGLPAQMNIVYVKQVTDTSQWDAAFTEYFSAKLAWRLAETLTQSQTKKESAARDARDSLDEAVRANAVELDAEYVEDDTWVLARLRN